MSHLQDIHRLLTEARRLISAADPKPGSVLDGVDELVHAALMAVENRRQYMPREPAKRPLDVPPPADLGPG